MDCVPKSPVRQPVLILSHSDGHLEVFGDRGVEIHLARVPAAHSRDAERTADDVTELLLPLRYRSLYRADRLRAAGSTRPLLPSVLVESRFVADMLQTLNRLDNMATPIEGAAKAVAAKLLRERRAAS